MTSEMALTASEISHIARLAKLKLEASEVESLRTDLSRVLGYIAVLDDVTVNQEVVSLRDSAVSSEGPREEVDSSTRKDSVAPSLDQLTFLNNAPKTLDHFLLVPAIK